MEDRNPSDLYLEMTDGPLAAYAEGRVPEVLATQGAQRATWWENCVRDRTDLPRKIPEFSHLGVYEVDATFVPPALPAGVTGHHFRRTPRPGQGRLTGKPTIGLSLVLVSPRSPDGAQALRDWADFVHIRHIAEVSVPGYSMITPYERATRGDPRFLHFYEMDTEDPEASFQAMTPLVMKLLGEPGSAAFDHWARHPELRIMYVNSFRRLGEQIAVSSDPGFFSVARAQRACRTFTDDPVSDELIGRVLETATYAPSAENRQPWEFVVVRDPVLRGRIGELMQRAWEQHGREHSEGRLSPALFDDVDRGATGSISAAPVLVVVAADTTRCLPATVPSSIFPALQNLLLAAGALGLGSALTTIATAFADELRAAVGLPEPVIPVAVVPLGVPAKPLGASRREPFAVHTHRDRYGSPWK